MLSNRLFSSNIKLSNKFVDHIQNTSNLCIYKLGDYSIPSNIFFPKAETLTLINCNKFGIKNILYPRHFPALKTVNYLSAHPGDYDIYKRFDTNLEWVFPNKRYDFYDFMMALGYGKKDYGLIKRYIINTEILDGKHEFDIAYKFDLNIPGYSIVNSKWWQSQFYEYLVEKQDEVVDKHLLIQELEELHLQHEVVKNIVNSEMCDNDFLDDGIFNNTGKNKDRK